MVEMTGFLLFKNAKQEMDRMPWQRAGILQPNITHDITFDSASSNSQLKELFEISIRLQSQGAEFIVWPEYTVPIYPLQTPFFRKQFSEFSTRHLPLLAGFTDFRSSEEVYNAAILFDGTRLSQYNKVHLTPFGEYVLFRKALFFVKKITDEIGDFTPGQQVDTLSLNRHRIATPICYEIIYPELVRLFVTRGAELIVTISNDSWFGQSWAPFQHLSMAVIRAIENRRYVLRSTSNGISATIEPTGQFQHRSPLAASDFFISRFHYLSRRTLFSSSGYLFPYLVMLGCVLYYGGNLLYRGWQRLHQPPKS